MNMFLNVPILSVGIKKVLNPLPDCLTPFAISQTELLLLTQILIVESPSEKNCKQRAGGENIFKTVLEEKAEVASLFFCQVCVLVEESVVFCLIDCLANNCREEPECWPAGQQFFISAI